MMNRSITIKLFLTLTVILLGISCTHNPFYKDQEITVKDYFEGVVELRDGLSPDSVWVWMETLDLLTKTDSLGYFELRLPRTGQVTDNLLTGSFFVYFYAANYAPDSAVVFIRDGLVEWGKGGVNPDGRIYRSIRLRSRLNVDLNMTPAVINNDYIGPVTGNLTLSANAEPVSIIVYHIYRSAITDWLMDKTPDSPDYPRLLFSPGTRGIDALQAEVEDDPIRLTINMDWPPVTDRVIRTYSKGRYHIIPQIRVSDVNLPNRLRERLRPYNLEFDASYVQYPLKVDGGVVEVR